VTNFFTAVRVESIRQDNSARDTYPSQGFHTFIDLPFLQDINKEPKIGAHLRLETAEVNRSVELFRRPRSVYPGPEIGRGATRQCNEDDQCKCQYLQYSVHIALSPFALSP